MARIVLGSKSSTIRAMLDQGRTVSEIAKTMNSNYSFVYGVAQRHLNRVPKAPKDSISEKIREMYLQGQSIAQIRKELNIDYSFAYSVIKRLKQQEAQNNDR
jgi:predicted DNA-binding ArsR family transcriptional regulator